MNQELKTDFHTDRVIETGIDIGQEKAREYTSNIKTYSPEIENEQIPAEVGFFTGIFFVIIFLMYFFRGR